MTDSKDTLRPTRFPRSSSYDPEWVLTHQMGPNPLWLVEWLNEAMDLPPNARVLDLGCGKALTSIFLAEQLKAQVWAVDLWVPPEDNWERICERNLGSSVFPMQAECHALPFPADFFDAVVSIDAYQYFGTDLLFLGYLSRFVRPGGTIGVVVPGLTRPLDGIPEHLTKPQANGAAFWEDECISFQTADWWQRHWEMSNKVDQVRADVLEDGWRYWRDFEIATEEAGTSPFPSSAEALDRDGGDTLGFVRVVAQTKGTSKSFNLYQPSLMKMIDG